MKTVLVVDDEPDMRIYISTLLEVNGYRVLTASNGETGIELAKNRKPDIIVLDVMMPKESGIQMYRELKLNESTKEIKVVFISAVAEKTFSHSQTMLNLLRSENIPSPEAYIEKPPEAMDILKTLASL